MYTLKYIFLTSIVFIECCPSRALKFQNKSTETLWNLSNISSQSRQNAHKYPYKYYGKYHQYYQNDPQFPVLNHRPHLYPQEEHYLSYPPNPTPSHPYRPLNQRLQESIMDVLHSIAKNDDLQCVPKIICEVTSGTISGRQQGLNLPVNVNMESLLGLLSVFNGVQPSPLLHFGKAALQGYTSKNKGDSCSYAYPNCPSDPDELVQYLNNHNGGFFRYFGGASPQKYFVKQPHYHPLSFRGKSIAEKRIQNSQISYIDNSFRGQKEIKFPTRHADELQNILKFPSNDEDTFENDVEPSFKLSHNFQNSLKFPIEETTQYYQEIPFRKGKQLPYDASYYSKNELDLQRPLPNHKASPLIFPDRTGTGDLRLDPEELTDTTDYFYQNTNNFGSSDDVEGGREFTFPSR